MRWIGMVIALAVGVAPARPALDSANTEEGRAGATPTVESTGMSDLNTIRADVTDWKFDAAFELPEIPEPSGLCYCELTGTIFVVDDGAEDRQSGLYEIDLDGNFKQGIKLGADLEGVTYCSANELLYIADEKDETVHIVEPRELKVQGSFQVSREFEGKEVLKAGGNGFEGIAWLNLRLLDYPEPDDPSKGLLLLLNQDDPTALVAINVDEIVLDAVVKPMDVQLLPQRNSGELYVDPASGWILVVNSWMNTVEKIDLNNPETICDNEGTHLQVRRWEVMPGMAQEGLTFDPQGRMWIGQDIGGVVRYVKGS